MTSEEVTLAVIEALDRCGIPYMLVGSLSSNFHGIARSTRDADILVDLADRSLSELRLFLDASYRFDPQTAFETVTFTAKNVIEVLQPAFTIELFHLSDDPHDRERFGRRIHIKLSGRDAWVASAEDVIITKLRWYAQLKRGKDRDDVRDVIAVQKEILDWPYIESWCDRHDTRSLLDEIRLSVARI
jgi:hypothetical protein